MRYTSSSMRTQEKEIYRYDTHERMKATKNLFQYLRKEWESRDVCGFPPHSKWKKVNVSTIKYGRPKFVPSFFPSFIPYRIRNELCKLFYTSDCKMRNLANREEFYSLQNHHHSLSLSRFIKVYLIILISFSF